MKSQRSSISGAKTKMKSQRSSISKIKSQRSSISSAKAATFVMVVFAVFTNERETLINNGAFKPKTSPSLFCKGFTTTSLTSSFPSSTIQKQQVSDKHLSSSTTSTTSSSIIRQKRQQHRTPPQNGANVFILFSMSPRGGGNNNSNRPTGVYSRPSAAIEKGSGFYVPGLEGSRVRSIFGVLVLILGYWNHVSGGVTKAMSSSITTASKTAATASKTAAAAATGAAGTAAGTAATGTATKAAATAASASMLADIALAQTTSEIVTVVLGSFLIVQGIIEAAKESGKIVVLTDPYQQQQQRQQYREDKFRRQQNQQQQQQSFYNDPNEFGFSRDNNSNNNGGGGFFNRITGNRSDGEFLLSDQDLYVSDNSRDIYRSFDNTDSDMRYSDDRTFRNNNNNGIKGFLGGIFNNNNNNNGQYRPNRRQNYNDQNRQRQSGLNDMDQTSFDSSQSFQPNDSYDNNYYNSNENPIVTSARLASEDRRPRDMGGNRKFLNNVGGTNSGMILSQNSSKGYYSQRRGGAMAPKVSSVSSGSNFASSSITNYGGPSNAVVNTDLGLDVMASTNLTYEQRECARWIGASIISMTPATHVLLVDYDGYGGPEILFSLGNFGNTFNDPNTANYIMSAVTTVQNSTGGRVAVPSTHRSAKLLPEFARRSVVLQRLPTFEPPGTQCLIVGSNQVLQAYASNDLAWFGSLVTYFSSI